MVIGDLFSERADPMTVSTRQRAGETQPVQFCMHCGRAQIRGGGSNAIIVSICALICGASELHIGVAGWRERLVGACAAYIPTCIAAREGHDVRHGTEKK